METSAKTGTSGKLSSSKHMPDAGASCEVSEVMGTQHLHC